MTINFISDLHLKLRSLDFKPCYGLFDPSKLQPADVLVIAGDLANSNDWSIILNDIQEKTAGKFKKVFFIKGNHDYWLSLEDRNDLTRKTFNSDSRKESRKIISSAKKEILKEEEKIDEVFMGVRFLGTTLWSPCWDPDIEKDKGYEDIFYGMADYSYIPYLSRKDVTEAFFKNSEWLKSKMSEAEKLGQKTVIVTHHGPRPELVSQKFLASPYNSAFFVMDESLSELKPALWIHGHSHDKVDKTIDGVRYARNPIGYCWRNLESSRIILDDYEIPDCSSWYNNIIEV